MIISRQEGDTWGKAVVMRLAGDLQKEFPGIRGFSSQNLWRMRQLYQEYSKNQKLSPMVREIGWSQNLLILMGCKDDLEREFDHWNAEIIRCERDTDDGYDIATFQIKFAAIAALYALDLVEGKVTVSPE